MSTFLFIQQQGEGCDKDKNVFCCTDHLPHLNDIRLPINFTAWSVILPVKFLLAPINLIQS
jgi:hypothetical protein